jgi:hypothetical protein
MINLNDFTSVKACADRRTTAQPGEISFSSESDEFEGVTRRFE